LDKRHKQRRAKVPQVSDFVQMGDPSQLAVTGRVVSLDQIAQCCRIVMVPRIGRPAPINCGTNWFESARAVSNLSN
jgi:hypothetical protein